MAHGWRVGPGPGTGSRWRQETQALLPSAPLLCDVGRVIPSLYPFHHLLIGINTPACLCVLQGEWDIRRGPVCSKADVLREFILRGISCSQRMEGPGPFSFSLFVLLLPSVSLRPFLQLSALLGFLFLLLTALPGVRYHKIHPV